MDDSVDHYLGRYPFHHESIESWPIQGRMRVRLSVADSLPPAAVSSSILAIVMNAQRQFLYLWPSQPSGSISHFLIGGRPEGNETPEETAVREVGEETGWQIRPLQMIGFRHFFHLEPRAEKTDRPYPDFIQPIFAARATAFDPALLLPDDQIPAEFIDLATAAKYTERSQHPLLTAACKTFERR